MVKVYDRAKKEYYEEIQYGEKALNFLYNNLFGRLLLKIAVSKNFSRLEQRRMEKPSSVKKIKPFIEKYGINTDDFEKKDYTSFNDFFTRRLAEQKCHACADKDAVISPADSKLLVFRITDDVKLNIKHSVYDIGALLRNEQQAECFSGGLCFVYRLTVDDYHRYCFAESGKVTLNRRIDGVLHTVSSLSQKYSVYTENCREYCVIETEDIGNVIQMEVGAMLVGKILNSDAQYAVKGEEKGFFSYGGSTIIILYGRDKVCPDKDILKNSADGIETRVRYGEKVGMKTC